MLKTVTKCYEEVRIFAQKVSAYAAVEPAKQTV
jgi:hypothetical protein